MTRILVSGLVPFDAGKTTFSLNLIYLFSSIGKRIFPFKPVAGHNIWYSQYTVQESLNLGLLIGNDALKYFKATGIDPRYINPVSIISVPIDLEKINMDFLEYEKYMSSNFFFMMRRSLFLGSKIEDHYYVSKAIRKIIINLEDVNKLIKRFNPIEIDDLVQAILDSHEDVSNSLQNFLGKTEHDCEIIESYNDAISPVRLSHLDYLFLLSPGKAFLVKGDRLIKVLSVMSSPPWVIRSGSILKYLSRDIVRSFDLPVDDSIIDVIYRK